MIPRCDNREEWLGPYLYHDLPFTDETAAAEHVEACASCGAEAADLRRLIDRLPAPAPVPAARPRRSRAWIPAAAAALAAAFLGFAAGRGSAPAPQNPPLPPPVPVQVTRAEPTPLSLFSPTALAFLNGGSSALPPTAQDEVRGRIQERR